MATTKDYIEYVCERLHGAGGLRYRKMFGEYMVYVNDKPVLLVCDNTVFVKIVPELAALMADAERGLPYEGAKEHYILDIDDTDLARQVVAVLETVTPLPKPKKKVSNASPERRWMHCMKKTAESVALFVVTIFSVPVMWCWQKVPTASWLSVTG